MSTYSVHTQTYTCAQGSQPVDSEMSYWHREGDSDDLNEEVYIPHVHRECEHACALYIDNVITAAGLTSPYRCLATYTVHILVYLYMYSE